MQKSYASVVFDRKKQLKTKGVGKVEINIYLSRLQRKFITVKTCTDSEWKFYKTSWELANEIAMYNTIVEDMVKGGEAMTIDSFKQHIGIGEEAKEEREKAKKIASATGFLDFMEEEINKERQAEGTFRRKMVVHRALKAWGKMNRFTQITVDNVCKFNEWLREDEGRSDVTLYNYHKALKMYTRAACEQGFIKEDPYKHSRCKFEKGKCKERRPLIESELQRIRKLNGLSSRFEKARDLFIFSAYTGLAYSDNLAFDFETMAEKHGDTYYIDGSRIKTEHSFFTPILPPAMEVLKKYDYQLPQLSNQKLNEYLKTIKELAKIHKPMTSHVARHSFATLILTYDIPIEKLSRMMGHSDIKTTQIYGKILKKTIEVKVKKVAKRIR